MSTEENKDIEFQKGDFRLKKITFIDHPILENLELNFCDEGGKPVDTIIIAGENGSGKSTLLDCLYRITEAQDRSIYFNTDIEVSNPQGDLTAKLEYRLADYGFTDVINRETGFNSHSFSDDMQYLYPFQAIYSDVAVNFESERITSVTSMEIDDKSYSRRSQATLANSMKQLLIDIKAMDAEDFSIAYDKAIEEHLDTNSLYSKKDQRIKRFKEAFESMFSDITFSHIVNKVDKNGAENYKDIIFLKNGKEISIDKLSSGEKQIVYRNSFLLKDKNALEGAFVFIDEPEISLHPEWQKRVLENYKRIFTNEQGVQTSQLFVVTHSPFIIHNEHRRNDKVIILSRDESGKIVVSDKPEYYKCTSVEAVQDAFQINDFSREKSVVYLEGRTDEQYFQKATEVFGFSLDFEFCWVGYTNDKGKDMYTGDSSVENAYHFLKAQQLPRKNICLCDCDVNTSKVKNENNAYLIIMQKYPNKKGITKGIENALVLDNINLDEYYSEKTIDNGYGKPGLKYELQKTKLCNEICALPIEQQKEIFVNLKTEIEKLVKIFQTEENE